METETHQVKAPDYARVVESLSIEELREEVEMDKGEPAYKAAVKKELIRRKKRKA